VAEVWRTVNRGNAPSAMPWRTMEKQPVMRACEAMTAAQVATTTVSQ
jgi:hypothetical protein